MFLDEKAAGEPHRPERPAGLPKRLWVAILLPIPVAIFSYTFAAVYALLGMWEKSALMSGIAEISVAFSLASMLVAIIRVRGDASRETNPPW